LLQSGRVQVAPTSAAIAANQWARQSVNRRQNAVCVHPACWHGSHLPTSQAADWKRVVQGRL